MENPLTVDAVGAMYPDGQPISKALLRQKLAETGSALDAIADQVAVLQSAAEEGQARTVAENLPGLAGMTDCEINNLAADHVLKYDSNLDKWVNIPTEPGIGQISVPFKTPVSGDYVISAALPFNIQIDRIVHIGIGGGGKFTILANGDIIVADVPVTTSKAATPLSDTPPMYSETELRILLADIDAGTTDLWIGINYRMIGPAVDPYTDLLSLIDDIGAGPAIYFDGANYRYNRHNLALHSDDLSAGVWTPHGTASVLGETITLPAVGDGLRQTVSTGQIQGQQFTLAADLKGTAGDTVSLSLGSHFSPDIAEFTLTADWQRHSLTAVANTAGATTDITLIRAAGNNATSAEMRSVCVALGADADVVQTTSTAVYQRRGAAYTDPLLTTGAFGPGILFEPASANNAKNNADMSGATAGPLSGAGSLPANWSHSYDAAIGEFNVVATGAEFGLPFIDMRLNFNNQSGSSHNAYLFFSNPADYQAVGADERWTGSLFMRKIAGGDFSGVTSWTLELQERTSANVVLRQNDLLLPADPPSTLTRYAKSITTGSDVDLDHVWYTIHIDIAHGQSCDVTLRIYAPQLEQLPFASSPIFTYGAALPRMADMPATIPDTSPTGDGALFIDYVALYDGRLDPGADRYIAESQGGLEDTALQVLIAGHNAQFLPQAISKTPTDDVTHASSGLQQAPSVQNRMFFQWDANASRLVVNGDTVFQTNSGFSGDDTEWLIGRGSPPLLLLDLKSMNNAPSTEEMEAAT